jgi:hypothetical protein
MINFYIEKSAEVVAPEIRYVLSLWGQNAGCPIAWNDQASDDTITIGFSNECLFPLTEGLRKNVYQLQLNSSGYIELANGQPDFITTVFYLVNSLQEYNNPHPNALGRFQYKESYQHRLGNVKSNVVQKCLDEISKKIRVPLRSVDTRFFLTHDIDMVHGALLEDGFHVIKKGRLDLFFKFLFNVAMHKPDWLNIDKILALESEYDCKSVFYWIVNKGIINARERNADYDFKSKKIQQAFALVNQYGNENGIHKSISAENFDREIEKYGSLPIGNRYHYLKFNLPDGYQKIEAAHLKLDASLGFAEEIGFRNSYGLPFQPYNIEKRKPFNFIEAPLHVMDRTFYQYKKSDLSEAEKELFEFFEKNRYNCVLSILWHNNFFTNYKFKGYLALYKKILSYIKENRFQTLGQQEIVDQYGIR